MTIIGFSPVLIYNNLHLSLFEAAMVDEVDGDHTRVEIQDAWEQMKQDLRSNGA